MSSSVIETAYNAVAYPGYAYPNTHPDHLAVMARLYGLEPAPVETCRVLEVGCNEGGNIIPMAHAMPLANFTGFDLAEAPIRRGQEQIQELGLKNIHIFQGDLLQVGEKLGEYDYILAHGLYAWVPEPVRDGLLALCRKHLAPNGVAFISYNALPGSYLRQMTREMMLYRTARINDPARKVEEGVELIRLLETVQPEGTMKSLLHDQLKRIDRGRPQAVYHDDFAPAYRPVYFFQFVEHAGRHGLQYLVDAELPPPIDPCFKPEFLAAVQPFAGNNRIAQEQMNDFARLRTYRETLLCRSEHELKHNFSAAQFRHLYLASPLEPVSGEGEDHEDETRHYVFPGGMRLRCDKAPVIAVLDKLIPEWPHALPFDAVAAVLAEYGIVRPEDAAMYVLQMAVGKMVDLHAWQPPLASGIAERPKASVTARREAQRHAYTATLWHFQLELSDVVGRRLLQLLDGTRNRAELLEILKAEFPEDAAEELARGIETNLKILYRAALLEE